MVYPMQKHIILIFAVCLNVGILFAQNKQYWDTTKQFYQKFELPAREKKLIEMNIPNGTLELVYRISILEINKNISNSLADILGNVPYAPAKIFGGSINLLSGISGTSKCNYYIFNDKQKANTFISNKNTTSDICYSGEKIVEQYSVLDFGQPCYKNIKKLYIVIENTNLIEKCFVVFEAIPKIDFMVSRGWNENNKTVFLNNCKNINSKSNKNINEDCLCVLGKVQEKYSVSEYNKLNIDEKNNIYKNNYNICVNPEKVNLEDYTNQYNKAIDLYNFQKYDSALFIIENLYKTKKEDKDLQHFLGILYLDTKQFTKSLNIMTKLDNEMPDNLAVKIDFAHALLLNNKYEEAKEIYIKHKNENINTEVTWKQQMKEDFERFEQLGINFIKYTKILKLIE